MSALKGNGGELRATIHITRKATGKVETYELVGRTTPEQHARIVHATTGSMAGQGAELKAEENDDDAGA